MDAELTYSVADNMYCVFRGTDMVANTTSYHDALKKFDQLCEEAKTAQCQSQL